MTKEKLLQLIKQDENLQRTHNFYEAIYIIGNYMVSGNFDHGYRTVDHADLLQEDCTYEELLHFGTVLVPENGTAIGQKHKSMCRRYGYKMLPVNKNNHIMGYTI